MTASDFMGVPWGRIGKFLLGREPTERELAALPSLYEWGLSRFMQSKTRQESDWKALEAEVAAEMNARGLHPEEDHALRQPEPEDA